MMSLSTDFPGLLLRWCAAGLLAISLCACSALQPSAAPRPTFYTLDNPRALASPALATATALASGPTLVVNPPRSAAGFDSQRIIYLREPHKLEYFAHSEWVDPPARMLTPLLVAALQSSGAFRAVVLPAGAATGDYRLDTELIRLQQDFQSRPSQVRFTLRATLVEDRTRRVVGLREFDVQTPATSDDPYGGVVAANTAVQDVMQQLSRFSAEALRSQAVAK